MSNTSYFNHQAVGTKNKCIDQVYIKVIDRRIPDRMDKKTMNQHTHNEMCESTHSKQLIKKTPLMLNHVRYYVLST